ncbi:response regulator [Bradymonadaceae bacterium TMQ3]|uniref:Response regulator n=1 Tax=Lujinxingia sediminis TaxID=2480984 RepID=A0ABY0CSW9_9DELT|nr:response regulator [Lujinxingia sediminis]RDV37825.1 response regulator [Bradymonadaceae bacterium TMQ3]RVU43227.1 response regulator [Lujinxingia sediminis]TXC75393.1 response regulator [Bradymonadales bacterium TMQ1]
MITSKKVAVLDDEPLIGDIVSRALKRQWEVHIFERPSEALAALEEGERYAVFLCDMMMPERTGMEVYQEIRRRWPEQAERMVIMSGISQRDRAGELVKDAGLRLVQKPFDLNGLRQVVDEVSGGGEEADDGGERGGLRR